MTRLPSLALAALLTHMTIAAEARPLPACDPSAPTTGARVVCAASGSGVEDSGLSNANITVTETGEITGGSRGLRFDDGVTVTNYGSITGSSDHGIQGDNDVVIENHGTIIGLGGDGVNIDDDGSLVNYGTIISEDDDGVQLEENPSVANHGTITAVDEGINVNVDGAYVLNTGTVTAVDDGINAANAAQIWNSGTITSTGAQDAIDLDSGAIFNSGLLQSTGGEDGIDFDAGGTQESYVMNVGTISGNIGINTDAADTQAQHVTNAGMITGTSGTAINLGAGNDSLTILDGSRITGLVELGAGTDTLTVNSSQAQTLTFSSLPEVTNLGDNVVFAPVAATPTPARVSARALVPSGTVGLLVIADNAPLSQADVLGREIAFGLGHAVLDNQGGRGIWLGGGAGQMDIAPSGAQGAELNHRNLVLGYGFGETGLSAFLGYGQGNSDLKDGQHEARIRSYFIGLGYQRQLGKVTVDGTLYAGRSHNALSSADTFSGETDYNGHLYGMSLRGSSMLVDRGAGTGFDIVVTGDLLRHETNGYSLTGLGNGSVDSRASTATALRVEFGAPMQTGPMALRPYLALTHFGGDQDDIALSVLGTQTSFAAADVLARNEVAMGMTFDSTEIGKLSGRIELSSDDAGNTGFSAGFGVKF